MKSVIHCRHGRHDWHYNANGLIPDYTVRECPVCKRKLAYDIDNMEWFLIVRGMCSDSDREILKSMEALKGETWNI